MTALDDTTAMASASSSIGSPVLDGSSVARSISKTLPRSISDVIRGRLEAADAPYLANDNIADHLKPGELELLQQEVTDKVRDLLRSLVIDIERDHNTEETAERVAKMYLQEVFKGRYHQQPKIASFPNVKNLDEIYTVGPITVRSACSHHLVPILGNCWIGIKPGERVIGLSKFARVADWVFSRPHIQEEAVMILADEIERLCEPKGLAILVKAQHYCMKWRGVKEPQTSMVNSVVRGDFRHDPSLKAEFFELVKQQESIYCALLKEDDNKYYYKFSFGTYFYNIVTTKEQDATKEQDDCTDNTLYLAKQGVDNSIDKYFELVSNNKVLIEETKFDDGTVKAYAEYTYTNTSFNPCDKITTCPTSLLLGNIKFSVEKID